MRHIGKKIIILVLVISAAVAGVMVYYPTIVAPPKDVPVEKTHEPSINSNINSISSRITMHENDSLYNLLVDKIALYQEEEFINPDLADDKRYELMSQYVEVFDNWCDDKFWSEVWYDSDHEYMLERIDVLSELLSNDYDYIAERHEDELFEIVYTIEQYRDARNVAAAANEYVSVETSRDLIRRADEYNQISPLYNCDSLTTALSGVKDHLGQLHYEYVEGLLDRLWSYRQLNLSKWQFEDSAEVVDNEITEFRNNVDVYGYAYDYGTELRDHYDMIIKEAESYYCPQTITIDLCDSWESMSSSPDNRYRAYQSFSNRTRDGQYAMMKFTISGYENFTFYIRSNGESSCDYVVVGKDFRPHSGYYDYCTRNKATSSTSLSAYTEVTYSNLNKYESYVIYVSYTKDSSNSYNDDRGYVLIPYN